jgi:hypothetical protein
MSITLLTLIQLTLIIDVAIFAAKLESYDYYLKYRSLSSSPLILLLRESNVISLLLSCLEVLSVAQKVK